MSVKDKEQVIIIKDSLNGEILAVIHENLYAQGTINCMILDIYYKYVLQKEHGIIISLGYES